MKMFDESRTLMVYFCQMTAYQKIFDEAIGNYGLITVAQAKALGITNETLVKLAHRGRLERIGYGVYRIDHYVPNAEGLDPYACAVAKVGDGAYLWGPSVLALHHLCPTNPSRVYVATPNRYRKKASPFLVVKDRIREDELDNYEGIRTQAVAKAILSSQHIIMLDRLLDAARIACERNLFDWQRKEQIVKELYIHDKKA